MTPPSAALALSVGGAVAVTAAALVTWHARRTGRALAEAVADRDRLTVELSRRLGELYSLQELTHVLSSSLLFDQVAADVARYATRFLDAGGGAVVLASAEGEPPRVVAAEGSLAPYLNLTVALDQGGIVLDAIAHERVELRSASGTAGLRLFAAVDARTAAVAPLKAHGVTDGAVVVVDKNSGSFVLDDARLLSTVAAHAAVALANARLFDLVRRGKEQWEGTFDAIAEGMALVDDDATIRRANTAFAALVGRPVTGVVGGHLCHLLFGEHLTLAELMRETAVRRPSRAGRAALRAAGSRPAHRRRLRRARGGRRLGRRGRRGHQRAADARGPADPEREDGRGRDAGLGRGPRAEQPADLDRRTVGVPARAAGRAPSSSAATCRSSTRRRSAPAGSCATCSPSRARGRPSGPPSIWATWCSAPSS